MSPYLRDMQNFVTKPMGAALVSVCLFLLAGILAPPSIAEPGTAYYWKWSDGSRADQRTFAEADFGSTSALPAILVTSRPASPGALITLSFRQNGTWVEESRGRLDDQGRATLHVNPYCEAAAWCDAQLNYRLKIDGQQAQLAVTYRPKPLPPEGNRFT